MSDGHLDLKEMIGVEERSRSISSFARWLRPTRSEPFP